MDYVAHFAAVAGIGLLAAVSPGPNFVMITAHALASRRAGFWAAGGAAAASFTWAMMGALGLALVVAEVVWLYEALRVAGALYLAYLGLNLLLSAWRGGDAGAAPAVAAEAAPSGSVAWRRGYLANMANPKSAAFVAGFFATVLPADAPTWLFVATATTVAGVSACWSFSLALLLSTGRARGVYLRAKRGINAVLGAVMLGLGARLALSR